MSYCVFIPCAGLGTRMGGLTRHLSKAMVTLAGKPAISHVLAQFPADTRFVIALGYRGELLREYLQLVHGERQIEFVDVACHDGPGSGLGHTLLCAEALLQRPFVFCSCDTLVEDAIPAPDHNWAAWADAGQLDSYRTLGLDPALQQVTLVRNKGEHDQHSRAYIGLAGIHDWQTFWQAMHAGATDAVNQGEAYGLQALLQAGQSIAAQRMVWHDIGTTANLAAAGQHYRPEVSATILHKDNEAIWFVDGKVVKFSTDRQFIANRVKRARELAGFVPPISAASEHCYVYPQIRGEVLSRTAQAADLLALLRHCENFWRPAQLDAEQAQRFKADCRKFYRDKTYERVTQFYQTFQHADNAFKLNGRALPSLQTLLDLIDWEWLANGLAGRFHGDFHFENILVTPAGEFMFLDWRQDFCGDLQHGDIYYDLAKLLHGLIVNHAVIDAGWYQADWQGDTLTYDFHRLQRLVECEQQFDDYLQQHGYDRKKVRILTALVFLNIAALHHHPYCLLLYGLGKTMLHWELTHVD